MVGGPDEGRGRVETNYPGEKTGEGPGIQKDYSGSVLAGWGVSWHERQSSTNPTGCMRELSTEFAVTPTTWL